MSWKMIRESMLVPFLFILNIAQAHESAFTQFNLFDLSTLTRPERVSDASNVNLS